MINRAVPQDPRPAHQHGDPPTHQPTHQPAAAPERQPTHQQAAAPERQPTHQAAAPEQQHMGARPHASSPDAPPPHPAARQGDGAPPAAPVRFEDSGTTFTGRRAEAPDHPHPGEPGWTARGDNPAGTNPQRETTSVPASPSPAGDGVPHPIVRPAVHQVMLNADRRAPLLPIHTAEDLARLQGDQANRIDPREALRASEWAHLREDAPAYRVEGRSGVNHHDGPVDAEATARKKAELDRSADVTVRRIGVRTGGGTRWVTEIEVKIRWVADLGVTAGKALQLQASAMDGVDLYFNHQHRLSDGSQLHVRLTFEEADGMKVGANEVVTFKPGRGRADQVTWYVSDGPHIHAHELGHHLGLRDEYHDPDYAGRRTLTDGGRVFGANLMGDAHRPHLSTNELMLDHHGHEVPPLAGLMDHHLQSIERLLHRAEAEDRRVDTPGRGEGEGEGAGEGVGEAGIRLRADELSRANHVAGTSRCRPIWPTCFTGTPTRAATSSTTCGRSTMPTGSTKATSPGIASSTSRRCTTPCARSTEPSRPTWTSRMSSASTTSCATSAAVRYATSPTAAGSWSAPPPRWGTVRPSRRARSKACPVWRSGTPPCTARRNRTRPARRRCTGRRGSSSASPATRGSPGG